MRHFQLVALGLAFTLVGCQIPLNFPQAMAPDAKGPAVVSPGGQSSADSKQPLMGTLRFAIRWPERDLPGFSAQVIPISTERIEFKLENPTMEGFQPIKQDLVRQSGEDIATTTLHLPHGGGYIATVTAYDKDGVPIADNTATNLMTEIDVAWGTVTPVVIRLDALFAPKITLLTISDPGGENKRNGHGTPGQILAIAGENLERGSVSPTVIFPSGHEVVGTRELDGTVTATIPEGAGSGQLKVKVDGVTSTSVANFQEVMNLELTVDGEEPGGMRDGDGAIASWLGDTFEIGVSGKDTAHALILQPGLTGWSYDGAGAITVDAQNNGKFVAQNLGRSSFTAVLGSVSSKREVIVAPPAGPIINPAGNASGIVNLDLIQVGEKWLAGWYDPIEKKISWRMLGPNGEVDPQYPIHSTSAAWDGFERVFAFSAAPDANGQIAEICLTYRLTVSSTNAIVFKALDTMTGAPKRGDNFYLLPIEGANRLLDTAANGTNHVIGFLNFDKNNRYNHQILAVRFDADGKIAGDLPLRPYNPTELTPYSYREDTMSITAIGDDYVVARHVGVGGSSGPTSLDLEHLNAELDPINETTILHELNRLPAVASNGETTLVASLELQTAGTVLKLYRYDQELKSIGTGTKIADLNIGGSDPLNWPLDLDWDGTDFILTYGDKVGAVVGNKIVTFPQAMVRKIHIDNFTNTMTIGDPYPLAMESMMARLAPTAEGGVALWLDAMRRPVLRRVKFR